MSMSPAGRGHSQKQATGEERCDGCDRTEEETEEIVLGTCRRCRFEGTCVDLIPCAVCREFIQPEEVALHHLSYIPEKILPLHQYCHNRIHREDGYHDHLVPVMTRDEAEREKERRQKERAWEIFTEGR